MRLAFNTPLTKIVFSVQNYLALVTSCPFLPPASAVEVIETEPSVCVSVCPCVNTLTAEPIDVRSQNLVHGLTLMTSRTGSMFKVIGQRSRSSS